jgi:hypothetical protein
MRRKLLMQTTLRHKIDYTVISFLVFELEQQVHSGLRFVLNILIKNVSETLSVSVLS